MCQKSNFCSKIQVDENTRRMVNLVLVSKLTIFGGENAQYLNFSRVNWSQKWHFQQFFGAIFGSKSWFLTWKFMQKMSNEGNKDEKDQFFATLLTLDRLKMGLCYVPAPAASLKKSLCRVQSKQSSQFFIAVIWVNFFVTLHCIISSLRRKNVL